LNIHCTKN